MTPNFLARHRKVSKIFVTCDGRIFSFSTVEAVEVSKVSKAQALEPKTTRWNIGSIFLG